MQGILFLRSTLSRRDTWAAALTLKLLLGVPLPLSAFRKTLRLYLSSLADAAVFIASSSSSSDCSVQAEAVAAADAGGRPAPLDVLQAAAAYFASLHGTSGCAKKAWEGYGKLSR